MELQRDTEREEEVTAKKKAWEDLDAGRAARGAVSRLRYLKDRALLMPGTAAHSPHTQPASTASTEPALRPLYPPSQVTPTPIPIPDSLLTSLPPPPTTDNARTSTIKETRESQPKKKATEKISVTQKKEESAARGSPEKRQTGTQKASEADLLSLPVTAARPASVSCERSFSSDSSDELRLPAIIPGMPHLILQAQDFSAFFR